MDKFIFKSSGQYLGFIRNGYLFSRDGNYLGWVENDNVWSAINGEFKGQLIGGANNEYYIVRNTFSISPIPKIPRISPLPVVLPLPQANITPTTLPIGVQDGF